MNRKESIIRFKDVTLGYGRRAILKRVQAEIHQGTILGIVGPNGSGKTTFLKSILGWVKPQQGIIEINRSLRFGYVPQRNTIDPLYPFSALDIVIMGLYGGRAPWNRMKKEDYDRASLALKQVGLHEKSGFLFSELSGGQQQRVLLARALVGKPDVLVLDEPTNGMDIVAEASVMDTVREVHHQTGATVIVVTHLLHVVAHYASEVGLIKGDQIEFGPISTLLTEKHLTELYNTPILVSEVQGRTVVVPR